MNMTTSLNLTLLLPLSNTTTLPFLNITGGSDNETGTPLPPAATMMDGVVQEVTSSLTDRLLSNVSVWAMDSNNTTTEAESTGVRPASKERIPVPAYTPAHNVLVCAVCGMGIALNVVNLLVLTERCLKESPYTYLTAMALLCLASLTMSLLQNCCMQNFTNNYYCSVYTYQVYFPCVNICSNSTMWLIVTLTVERFLFIRHPLWARAKCDRRAAKMKICMVILVMVVLNIPRFFFYKVVPHKDKGPGYYTFGYNHFSLSQATVVISWLYSVIIQMIPMSVLCVLNFYLVYAVHQARRLRKRQNIRNNMEAKWSREQTRLTITLISIVFFFLVCIMPSAFSEPHVAYVLFGRGQTQTQFRQSAFFKLMGIVTNLLVFCQLSFNFVPFSAFNDKFRAVFKRMLHRWAEQIRRCVSGRRSSRSMCRLMRLDAAQGNGGGVEIIGHNNNNINNNNNNNNNDSKKLQLRSSNNSMSSSKDTSQTKSSVLEMAS